MPREIPPLTPIKSSVLSGHHYDAARRTLTVQFNSGAVHEYDDVPIEKAVSLGGAASPGSYFSARIKGNHVSRKISG